MFRTSRKKCLFEYYEYLHHFVLFFLTLCSEEASGENTCFPAAVGACSRVRVKLFYIKPQSVFLHQLFVFFCFSFSAKTLQRKMTAPTTINNILQQQKCNIITLINHPEITIIQHVLQLTAAMQRCYRHICKKTFKVSTFSGISLASYFREMT